MLEVSNRLLVTLGLSFSAALATAQWTVTILHPSSRPHSYSYGGSGTLQVGNAHHLAALWTGTAGSYLSLHPTGAFNSYLLATNGQRHVGYASPIQGTVLAGYWNGTSNIFTALTSAANQPARATAIDGNTQAGFGTFGLNKHALKWSGTIGSMVDLNPQNAAGSEAHAAGGGKQGGFVKFSAEPTAALWSGSAESYLELHPTGYKNSEIRGMSTIDQVGYGRDQGNTYHALLWRGTKASMVDLHTPGYANSYAQGTNGQYQVGKRQPQLSGPTHATIWKGTAASAVNLHAFLPSGTNYIHSTAHSVWVNNGTLYVAGFATIETPQDVAVLWQMPDPYSSFEFTLNKTQVAGQNSVQGTITALAVPQARTYTISDDSSLVTTPASVVLASNATVRNFQITVTAVNATINTTIYARYAGLTRSVPLALVPLVPTALAFTPATVTGGSPVSCRVVINGVAGPNGRTIAILDNSPNATAPSTVTVPPGATQVIFNIATTAVTSQKTVTVTARVSAGEKTGTFKINPQP